MSLTKQQIITQALPKIGLRPTVFDQRPDNLISCLNELDTLANEVLNDDVYAGYPVVADPELSDLSSETNIPSKYNSFFINELAVRIASHFGKEASPTVRQIAGEARNMILRDLLKGQNNRKQPPSRLPLGAGNKYPGGYSNYFSEPKENQTDDTGL